MRVRAYFYTVCLWRLSIYIYALVIFPFVSSLRFAYARVSAYVGACFVPVETRCTYPLLYTPTGIGLQMCGLQAGCMSTHLHALCSKLSAPLLQCVYDRACVCMCGVDTVHCMYVYTCAINVFLSASWVVKCNFGRDTCLAPCARYAHEG